jgi:hypothetical protein
MSADAAIVLIFLLLWLCAHNADAPVEQGEHNDT